MFPQLVGITLGQPGGLAVEGGGRHGRELFLDPASWSPALTAESTHLLTTFLSLRTVLEHGNRSGHDGRSIEAEAHDHAMHQVALEIVRPP